MTDQPTSPPALPPEPAHAAIAGGAPAAVAVPATPMSPKQVERAFLQAKAHAEGAKQAAIKKALQLKEPEQTRQIRIAEAAYHESLAAFCQTTQGLLDSSVFKRAAANDLAGIPPAATQ